jgi:hypothetical protein
MVRDGQLLKFRNLSNPMNEYTNLKISLANELTEEMDRLRSVCFPSRSLASSRDVFDSKSYYPVIEVRGELAAFGRLTPGPQSVFETWTHGKAQIPTGPDVIDLGRCMVAPKFRQLDLITLLCVEGFLIGAEKNFRAVVGAVKPGRKLANRLYAIGFKDSGPAVRDFEPNGDSVIIQPVVAIIEPAQIIFWNTLKTKFLADFC